MDRIEHRIEVLANEIAVLSNDSLGKLAAEMVANYPGRGELFQYLIKVELQEQDNVRS